MTKKPRLELDQTLSWKGEGDCDVAPSPLRFRPAREPGMQLNRRDSYTPASLFKLFFSEDAVKTLCKNTNKQAARNLARGAKYKWVDVGVDEFYRYIGLTFYMAMMKLNHVSDFWRRNNIFSVPFPSLVSSHVTYLFQIILFHLLTYYAI